METVYMTILFINHKVMLVKYLLTGKFSTLALPNHIIFKKVFVGCISLGKSWIKFYSQIYPVFNLLLINLLTKF